MHLTKKLLAGILLLAFFFTACKKEIDQPVPGNPAGQSDPVSVDYVLNSSMLQEDFEIGTKTAYAAANVTIGTGSWYFDEALLGTSSSDRKNGSKSVRIRNTGRIRMNFNYASGASTVTVKHAVYGSDGSSTWELQVSANGGSTYTKVGSTVTTASTTLQTASFTVNVTGNVRIAILKTGGGSNRINIDDVQINASGSGGGGGGGGGTDNDHLLMGNPSNATADVANFNNYLMIKTYFDLSYSRDRGTPNWVSWHLYSGDLGSTPRQDDFRADNTLPAGWYQVQNTSYSGSGFDRGHNCPSADRTITVAANSATFLMTNMIPQAPNNNQRTWANMENYIRTLITAGNEVYIIMGCYGTGGTGSNGTATTINNGHVTVPNRIWKVVVVLPNGNNDLSRVSTGTRVIAVNTPNINSISSDWKTFRTSVDAIESATGYDLLSNVPASVQSVIEAQVDNL